MKIEYRAFREIDSDLPDKVIEYCKDELRYKILQDNGVDKEILKEIDELITYFEPKYLYTKNLLSTRMKDWIASFLGKKDFILMGMKAYEDIITILRYRREALLKRLSIKQTPNIPKYLVV